MVERDDGREVRYVIDFYAGRQGEGDGPRAPAAMHLDVRPALDSLPALFARLDLAARAYFRPMSLPAVLQSRRGGDRSSSSKDVR